ncbi:MAG TPA: adenylate/guanylate cyclase domain-containing protein [Acidimicrobiales bacterium]|nr:adenylate/guanylate cyclase domain-containing protein [Acidimicrobiales bacterium]
MTCASCGSEVPSGARFCPHCGHQVYLRGDQRRVATVLFADLAGFTGLSETLDPESVKNVVDQCFAALAGDVTSHGGRVDKVVGDAIMAIFGAPRAHEDDAERAVRTGLQMQLTIADLGREIGLPLQLRVGINTGEVLVGGLRAGGDYTAMGDAVNVASRLQTSASPGTVVVGPATHAATVGVVSYRDLGPLHARGREEPVEAWEAVECLVPPGHRPTRTNSPLVGRDDELALLRHGLASSMARSRASLVVLVGDAGIGKSRLTEELATWSCAEHDALVLEGRCVPYGEANPWWPVAEAVRQACGIEGRDPAETAEVKCRETVATTLGLPPDAPDVRVVTAGLMHLMGDQDALADVDPQRARQGGRKALNTLVAGLARRRPVMIVLSEMHWADDLVLELVGAHMERLARLPVSLVLTGRPELLERWDPPRGRHNLTIAHIDPLDPESSRSLVAALLEGAVPPGLADTVAERSGGNPLFLEELVSLVASGTSELPVTLRGIVAARVDHLPIEERSILEDAAVVGRSGLVFTLRALARARGAGDAEQSLNRLVGGDLLTVDGGRWEFRSDVVREVVYDTLTKSDRARRHSQLGTWITEQSRRIGREDEFLEQVAHHHATAAELVTEMGAIAGVPDDAAQIAFDALSVAAVWAMDRELLLPAVRLLDRALSLSGPIDPESRRRLLLDRALVRTNLRELAGAGADLEEAEAGADALTHARYLTVLGFLEQTSGEMERSMATLEQAVDAWRALGDREGEGDALRRAGMTSLFAGDVVHAEKLLTQGLSIARSLGSRRDEAWALWHLAWAAFASDDALLAEERLREAADAFMAVGDAGGQGWVKGLLGYIRLTQGRRAEAERLALDVLDDARDRGDRWAVGMLLVLLGLVRLWEGAVGSAVELGREAKMMFASIGDPAGLLRAMTLLARALASAGRMSDARRVADDAQALGVSGPPSAMEPFTDRLIPLAVALQAGDWRTATGIVVEPPLTGLAIAEIQTMKGLALLQAGQISEGRAALEEAARQDGPHGAKPNLWATLALGRAAAGDAEGAIAAADEALASDPPGTYRDDATAEVARAFAFGTLGRRAEAAESLAHARSLVGPTEDRLMDAVVELAAARVGADGQAAASVLEHLGEMGATGDGWDNVFRAAAGVPSDS